MKRGIFILFLLLPAWINAQDTIRLDPSVKYYSGIDSVIPDWRSPGPLGREIITFSDSVKKYDYCFYVDNKRTCSSAIYHFRRDSILERNQEVWVYDKQEDEFALHRTLDGTYEWGMAKSLFPLIMKGVFITTTADKKDTLWTSDYAAGKDRDIWPRYTYFKTRVSGPVYESRKVDELPRYLNGDSIKPIHVERKDACINEPLYHLEAVTFVITSEGRIVNVEMARGNLDLNWCPYYMMDVIRYIIRNPYVKPAKYKGKPVNVKWTLRVTGSTHLDLWH
ncbi:MAG TPA: hypothetical protein VNZ86_03185 [Bacteroidia bacterium]|nr:hypothetical protein [Bacteroidia bacterium]